MPTNFSQLNSPYIDYDDYDDCDVSFGASDSPAASDFDSFDEFADDRNSLPSIADLIVPKETAIQVSSPKKSRAVTPTHPILDHSREAPQATGGYPSVLIEDIHHYNVTDDCHPSRGFCKHMLNNQFERAMERPNNTTRDDRQSRASLSDSAIGAEGPQPVNGRIYGTNYPREHDETDHGDTTPLRRAMAGERPINPQSSNAGNGSTRPKLDDSNIPAYRRCYGTTPACAEGTCQQFCPPPRHLYYYWLIGR